MNSSIRIFTNTASAAVFCTVLTMLIIFTRFTSLVTAAGNFCAFGNIKWMSRKREKNRRQNGLLPTPSSCR